MAGGTSIHPAAEDTVDYSQTGLALAAVVIARGGTLHVVVFWRCF